ncbi:hypothetical protein, partial [Corallococcus llansteffanensis]
MIPVSPHPPPANFDTRVTQPGMDFLATTPTPTDKEWKNRAYWTRVLDDLYQAYGRICAYSCQRIECTTGDRNVEHFKPKKMHPQLAYDWSNYRLVCSRLNSRKGTKTILDPFTLAAGSFAIRFPSLEVVPGPLCNADATLKTQVDFTCNTLKLNDETTCIRSRLELIQAYCRCDITFAHLAGENPFLAGEMQRQNLVKLEVIRRVMSYSPPTPP